MDNNWRADLTEQELELINTAQVYAAQGLKGMGGHHMALLNAKLVAKLDRLQQLYLQTFYFQPKMSSTSFLAAMKNADLLPPDEELNDDAEG